MDFNAGYESLNGILLLLVKSPVQVNLLVRHMVVIVPHGLLILTRVRLSHLLSSCKIAVTSSYYGLFHKIRKRIFNEFFYLRVVVKFGFKKVQKTSVFLTLTYNSLLQLVVDIEELKGLFL